MDAMHDHDDAASKHRRPLTPEEVERTRVVTSVMWPVIQFFRKLPAWVVLAGALALAWSQIQTWLSNRGWWIK
jgi:hypothetical protein